MSHHADSVFENYKLIWDKTISYMKEKYPIDVLFLYSDKEINHDYIILNNNLISKCEENYWNALLIKTINGLKFFQDNDYELVFKTNLSTILNVHKFYDYCSNLNNDNVIYEGRIGSYSNYLFCSGAGMLLNKKSVKIILDNLDKVDDTWTDDIFIGYILNKLNGIQPIENGLNRFDITSDIFLSDYIKNYTHIRVKIRELDKDVYYTNKVFEIIYN